MGRTGGEVGAEGAEGAEGEALVAQLGLETSGKIEIEIGKHGVRRQVCLSSRLILATGLLRMAGGLLVGMMIDLEKGIGATETIGITETTGAGGEVGAEAQVGVGVAVESVGAGKGETIETTEITETIEITETTEIVYGESHSQTGTKQTCLTVVLAPNHQLVVGTSNTLLSSPFFHLSIPFHVSSLLFSFTFNNICTVVTICQLCIRLKKM